MAETTIEWTRGPHGEQGYTFNPWTGCTKVGPGCDHCYAEGWAKRSGIVQWGPSAERRRTSEANWRNPLKWNAEAKRLGIRYRVFCASLADVFDNEVPDEWRADLFDLIARTPNLDWLLVTKRIGNVERMVMDALRTMFVRTNQEPTTWPWANVWLGITVVNQAEADRDIPKLLATPAAVRFLSAEPLLGPVNLRHLNEDRETNEVDCLHPWTWEQEIEQWRDTDDEWEEQFEDHYGVAVSDASGPMHASVDWVIVGGESGPGARPMHPQWARDLRDQCAEAGVPFLFKQHGEWIGVPDLRNLPGGAGPGFGSFDHRTHDQAHDAVRIGKKAAGRLLDGVQHDGYPSPQ